MLRLNFPFICLLKHGRDRSRKKCAIRRDVYRSTKQISMLAGWPQGLKTKFVHFRPY